MTSAPIDLYLKKLEHWRARHHFSRSAAARELGIPPATYAHWYRKGPNRTKPSNRYTRWLKSFLLARGILSVHRFLEQDGPRLLKRLGFTGPLTVMDFGCGNGDYSLILAEVVGPEGQLYALDKNKDVLYELMGRAKGNKLDNITTVLLSAETDIPKTVPLPDESIDAGWFCDVIHDGYFEKDEWKEELLRDVHRALRRGGFIAIHPVHMDEERLKRIGKAAGLHLEHEYHEELLFHGGEFHRGTVLKFRKP